MPTTLGRDEAAALPPFFETLARVADEAILPLYRTALDVGNKRPGGFDPVTEADRDCETALRRSIAEVYPDAGILGEEFGAERLEARDVWVLDPIDGTRAFIAGIPVWGVLAGLRREGCAVAGLMHQPFNGESFVGLHAEDGSRAFYRVGRSGATWRRGAAPRSRDAYAMTTSAGPPRRPHGAPARSRPAPAFRRRLLRLLHASHGASRPRHRGRRAAL